MSEKTPTEVKQEIPPNNEAKMEVKVGDEGKAKGKEQPKPTIEGLQREVKKLKEENDFLLNLLITQTRKIDDLGFQTMAISRAVANALKERKMAE